MKIRMYNPEKDSEKTIWIPTGFLFGKVGLFLMSRMASRAARKEYEKKLDAAWHAQGDLDVDDLISLEDVQKAERLDPPLTEEHAMELFTALKDSKYLMHGLPLISIDTAEGMRIRVDL